MSVIERNVLVLNASYEPLHVCTVRRALLLVWKGVARVEDAGAGVIRTPRSTVVAPSVVRLTEYRRVHRPRRSASRRAILQRDRHTCQYCGLTLVPAALTLDHVLPRSRGGESSWENLVAACQPCNLRKGNRTPAEARMALLRPAHAYSRRPVVAVRGSGSASWAKYIFAD